MELPPLTEPPDDDGARRRMRQFALAAAVVLLVIVAAWAVRRRDGGDVHAPAPPRTSPFRREVRAPSGVRIRVEVVNATKTRGLARRATQFLRDRGFDVVDVGTSAQQLDTTLVLDRSGHPEWARLVAEALGGGARAVERPDSSRYLDVTVQLGASWRPPAQPFYP